MYGRLSENPGQRKVSVPRQMKDGCALADRNGWQVVGEYGDDGISALRGKHRPGYAALMDAVHAGEVDRIVVYQTSRLWRNRRERAESLERLGKLGVSVEAVQGPSLDLATASGRMLAGLLGEFDTAESEIKSERVVRVAQDRAVAGKAAAHVLFGWRRVVQFDDRGNRVGWHDEVDPRAAAVVSELVDRLLAGESMNALAGSLNERRIPTPRESLRIAPADEFIGTGSWITSTVRKVVTRPANVARRVHHRNDFGPAAWPPIVDVDRHARVVALLSDPSRRTMQDGRRRNLLSTSPWATCGVCGTQLRQRSDRRGHRLYVCDSSRGCVGRSAEQVDKLVGAAVIAYLDDPDNRARLLAGADTSLPDLVAAADKIEARMGEAADAFAAGAVTVAQLKRITSQLRPELEDAQRAVKVRAARTGTAEIRKITPTEWAAAPLTRKRAILTAIGTRVQIMPTRRGPVFRPEDVQVRFGA